MLYGDLKHALFVILDQSERAFYLPHLIIYDTNIDISVPPLPPRVLFACSPYGLPNTLRLPSSPLPPRPPWPAEGTQCPTPGCISKWNGEAPGPNPNEVTKNISLWAAIFPLLAGRTYGFLPPPPPTPSLGKTQQQRKNNNPIPYLASISNTWQWCIRSIVAHSNHFSHRGRSLWYEFRDEKKVIFNLRSVKDSRRMVEVVLCKGNQLVDCRGRCVTVATVLQGRHAPIYREGRGMQSLTLIHIFILRVFSVLCIHAEATKEHRAAIVNRVCKVDAGIYNDTSVLADDGKGVWACQVDCRTRLE